MAEQIISKRCSKCKEIKPLSEFHKNKARKGGYAWWCKICCSENMKKYNQTEKGRATQRRRNRSEKGKVTMRRYRQSEHGKAAHNKAIKRYNIRHPDRVAAHQAIAQAIKDGQLPHPESLQCSCGEPAKQYHHHKGYEPEYFLDVIPVCVKCHKKLS